MRDKLQLHIMAFFKRNAMYMVIKRAFMELKIIFLVCAFSHKYFSTIFSLARARAYLIDVFVHKTRLHISSNFHSMGESNK